MTLKLTHRQRFMLAAMSTSEGAQFAPVQIQKLFFLVDENISGSIGGPLFNFRPYDYGPFDAEVYEELKTLQSHGLVEITPEPRGRRRYRPSPSGYNIGQKELARLGSSVSTYLKAASRWVLSLSFPQLVGAIYKAYPRMRENSIFVD